MRTFKRTFYVPMEFKVSLTDEEVQKICGDVPSGLAREDILYDEIWQRMEKIAQEYQFEHKCVVVRDDNECIWEEEEE